MTSKEQCRICHPHGWNNDMMRTYIRKYDSFGKAKWIAIGWYCEKCKDFKKEELG